MDSTERKTYIVNVESNLKDYLEAVLKAREEVDRLTAANTKMQASDKATAAEKEQSKAALKAATDEYRTQERLLVTFNKALNSETGSRKQLNEILKLQAYHLGKLGDGLIKDEQGVNRINPAYIKLTNNVKQTKDAIIQLDKAQSDGRSSVGLYSEAIEGALSGVGNKLKALLGPAALVAAAIALAKKVFEGLKEAVMSTTYAIDIMNKSVALSKQLYYDLAINGQINIKNLSESLKIQEQLNELRLKDSLESLQISKLNREEQAIRELSIDKTKTHAERLEYLNKVVDLESQKTKIKIGNLKDELDAMQDLLKIQPANEKIMIKIIDLRTKINDTYAEEDIAMRRINSQRTGFIQEEIDGRKKLFDDYYKWIDTENERKDKEALDAKIRLERQEIDEQLAGQKHFQELSKQIGKEGMLLKTKESKHRGFFDIFKDLQEKTVEVLKDTNQQASESDTRLTDIKTTNQERWIDTMTGAMDAFSVIVGRQTEAGKAFAIAEATIDTFVAAGKVLKDETIPSTLLRVAMMSVVILRGLANVKQIMDVKVGSTSTASAPSSISMSVPAARTYAPPAGGSLLTSTPLSQSQLNALPNQNLLTAQDIANAIANLPAPIVSIEDINARIAAKNKVEVRSII